MSSFSTDINEIIILLQIFAYLFETSTTISKLPTLNSTVLPNLNLKLALVGNYCILDEISVLITIHLSLLIFVLVNSVAYRFFSVFQEL